MPSAITPYFAFSCFAAFLGAVCFGWNTGVINNPKNSIVAFINASAQYRYSTQLDAYTLDLLWGVVVAIFAVGGMFGALISGAWAERLGRKLGMMANCCIGILSALLMGVSEAANSVEMLIIGRLLVGFCSALYTGLVPLYLVEVAPKRLRGGVGVLNQLGVVVGLFLSQAVSLDELLGGETLWPVLLILSGMPSLLQAICLPWCPESPRHLLLTKQDESSARSALRHLRGSPNIESEVSEILSEGESDKSVVSVGLRRLCQHWQPLTVACVLHLSQQLSGINIIFYYSAELFTSVGASESDAKYATMAVGGIMILMTLVSIPLMDAAGRRSLHLLGLLGIVIFSGLFTLLFSLSQQQESPGALAWLSVAVALLVVASFASGPGSIPWLMTSELFGQELRASANAVGVLVNWLANFSVGILFPVLQSGLNSLVFLPFTVLSLIFLVFLYFRMPETKGRSIEEVTRVTLARVEPLVAESGSDAGKMAA